MGRKRASQTEVLAAAMGDIEQMFAGASFAIDGQRKHHR